MKPGDIIFISASVPYREGWTKDARPAEIEEAIVCVARAVFARGGRLLFGGHPSVSCLIASVAGEYFEADPARTLRPVITFQSELFRRGLPDETWLLYRMGWSSIQWTEQRFKDGKPDRDASLRFMRERMLSAQEGGQLPKAMIAIGGMEGVMEEAEMFLERARPSKIYAIPSGGGAAARLLVTDDPRLKSARATGQLVNLERFWKERHPDALPENIPFVPYAAVVQFIFDHLDG